MARRVGSRAVKFRIAHIFCGIGGKGLGAAAAVAAHGDVSATFETVGGIDIDPLACRDFEMLVGAPALCADVHELQPADLRRFLGRRAPDVVMMSPPCKGFSGLLSAKRAAEPRYQLMNQLMERALFLVVSTWKTPPKLIFVENVPRIQSRGRDTIRRCIAMGEAHGYAIAQGNHDCGELGGLAQHRRRYFQLWRHRAQVPNFVYEPPRLRVRACGEVLGPLPMPGDVAAAGPMHSIPRLSWRNWVRLALIPAGGDWRDLPDTLGEGEKRRERFRRAPVTAWDATAPTVTGPGGSAPANVADPRFGNVDRVAPWDGPVGTITRAPARSSGGAAVADPRIALPPNGGRHWNKYAVHDWRDPASTITGTDGRVGSGAPSVADPRWGATLGVTAWSDAAATVTGESLPSNGRNAVADPRLADALVLRGERRNDDLGVLGWEDAASTISGQARPRNGRFSVADPRGAWQRVAGVTPWTEAAPTITAGAKIHAGAFQVADPRIDCQPRAGAYRVLRWDEAAATITASLGIDNGAAAVADPRLDPDRAPPFTPLIIAADGTWHRPLTTLELAALQSFPTEVDGKPLVLAGSSHTRWREAIGNAVPPLAAAAIGNQLLRALLLTALGIAFSLGGTPVWVAPERRLAA